MGEIPVAVVKKLADHSHTANLSSDIRELVNRELGSSFALGGVYTVEEIGLDEFPLTASGKVRKVDLKERVEGHHRRVQSQAKNLTRENSYLKQVTDVWSHVLGYPSEKIDPLRSITELADSLNIMVFCHEVENACGKRLTLPDVVENDTPAKQAAFLENKEKSTDVTVMPTAPPRSGPPPTKDIALYFGSNYSPDDAAEVARPALEALNLSWEGDVEDVYSNNDRNRGFSDDRQRWPSSNIRWAYQTSATSVTQLRSALETTLTLHSTLRSIYIKSKDVRPVHLIIRPSARWFDQCIHEMKPVDTAGDLKPLLPDMTLPFGTGSGPLFHASIIPLQDSGKMGMIVTAQHSTFDAFSMMMFYSDLSDILQIDSSNFKNRISFKLYADMYHLHRNSRIAQDDIEYCIARLKGISNHSKAFWPTKIGNTESLKSPGSGVNKNLPAVFRKEGFPNLQELKKQHSIEAGTVVKAAVALFNVETTGHTHAVFSNLEAGRRWPFVEGWIADRLPNPLNIAGPTMGSSLNLIPIEPDQGTLAFLTQIQQDQIEKSKRAAAPFWTLMERLGEEEGEILPDLGRRQVLNWDPSMRHRNTGGNQSLKLIDRKGWGHPEAGMFWNMGLVDDETLVGFVMCNDALVAYDERFKALRRVFELVGWISEPENWARRVGDRVNMASWEVLVNGDGAH